MLRARHARAQPPSTAGGQLLWSMLDDAPTPEHAADSTPSPSTAPTPTPHHGSSLLESVLKDLPLDEGMAATIRSRAQQLSRSPPSSASSHTDD